MPGMRWWVADLWEQSPVLLVSWVVWVIGSIVLHELAHGWMAIRLGDDTPIVTGHMTWNPLVHMGQFSLVMFALVGFAWGQMPVNPSRMRGPFADAKVAFAGPMMNVSLAVVALVLYTVVRGLGGGAWVAGMSMPEPLYTNAALFCWVGIMLNVILALFNLVPIPPLDGWRIGCDISSAYNRLWQHENAPMIGMIAFMALFYFGAPSIEDFGSSVAGDAARWSVRTFAPGSAQPQPPR